MLFKSFCVVVGITVSAAPALAASSEDKISDQYSTASLHAQVLLDRLLLSPGAIDGLWGHNAESALIAFQQNRGAMTGKLDEATSTALLDAWRAADQAGAGAPPEGRLARQLAGAARANPADNPVAEYTISEADAGGRFAPDLPDKMEEMAKLPALPYRDMKEMLAERFHCTPELLTRLNPDAKWRAGEVVLVPNVLPTDIEMPDEKVKVPEGKVSDSSKADEGAEENRETGKQAKNKAVKEEKKTTMTAEAVEGPVTVIVSKKDTSLSVLNKAGDLAFHAPVTAGSEHDPLPIGEWKVNGTEMFPHFNYNPDLFWDADESDKKAKIPAGPNNPVGVAWIDISKPHYGLHGTPEPSKIGYSESHGCVRLTNWDVIRLSKMVKPGTKVYFVDTPEDRLMKAQEIKTARTDERSKDQSSKEE